MTRNQHLAKNARRTSISLTPAEELAVDVIQKTRRSWNASPEERMRDTPSEIVADAVWHYLKEKYGKTRQDVEALLPAKPPVDEKKESNVRKFPEKGNTTA